MNLAAFDIETYGLQPHVGIVLCAAFQPVSLDIRSIRELRPGVEAEVVLSEPYIIRGDQCASWREGHRYNDSEVVRDIIREVLRYDGLIAHNGWNFDVPYLESRYSKWYDYNRTDLIAGNVFVLDTYYQTLLRRWYGSRSLAQIAQTLGTPHQKELTPLQWWPTAVLDSGEEGSAAYQHIVDHCLLDVTVLAEVYERIKHLFTVIRR